MEIVGEWIEKLRLDEWDPQSYVCIGLGILIIAVLVCVLLRNWSKPTK